VELNRVYIKSFSLKGHKTPQENEIVFFSFLDFLHPGRFPRALDPITDL
jgi:hypothetical protein